jgi:hypothetical protein
VAQREPKKSPLKSPKLYTESRFATINEKLIELQEVMRESARLEVREDALRAELLELTKDTVSEDDKTVLPGCEVVEKVTYDFDEDQVMDWIFDEPGNLYTALPLVTVSADLTGIILGQALNDPSMRRALKVNPNGVYKAISTGSHKGLPHGEKFVSQSLRITSLNLKTGSELRAALDIIPDDVGAEESAVVAEE